MPTTHVIADLVRQQTTTTGTGTLFLGTVPSGCRGVVAGIGDGKKARYKLSASDGGWEVGLGTVTDASPDTFSRDVVYASSAGGTTKITLPAGTHTLDVTLDAKSANEMTPRLLGIGNGVTLAGGTLTVDFMGSCDVLAVVVMTGNVTTFAPSNLPERATVEMWVTHSGGPWTFPQNAWPAGTTLHGSYNLYTDGTITRFWWTTADSGATSILECNAPASGGVTNGDAHDHSGGDGGQIAYSSLSGLPTLGSAAAQNTTAFEPAGSVSSHAALTTAHGISAFGATLVDDADAAAARATLGIGASISDGSTLATGLTFPNAGLKIQDLDASNSLTLKFDADDTGDRTLSFRVNGSSRILTMNASATLSGGTHSGNNTGDQTITLTGPVTGTGTGTFATAVTANAITLANLAATTQYKLLGRATAGSGNWEEITATANVYSILQAADYAAIRTLLGLVIGTNVQAYNASATTTVASGTAALGTSAIASGASASVVTVAATGVATTDTISWGFNVNPNSVTGYSSASTTGCLVITAYPTANNVNFVVTNSTAGSITPGALTLNWRVVR